MVGTVQRRAPVLLARRMPNENAECRMRKYGNMRVQCATVCLERDTWWGTRCQEDESKRTEEITKCHQYGGGQYSSTVAYSSRAMGTSGGGEGARSFWQRGASEDGVWERACGQARWTKGAEGERINRTETMNLMVAPHHRQQASLISSDCLRDPVS